MYFLYLGGTKKAAPINANRIKNEVFILHCSGFGYIPYMNLLNQTLTKTQQAPSLVQSSLAEPLKSASKSNQSNSGGVYLKSTNMINKYINTSDVIKTLDKLGMKNSINREFTQNTVAEIVDKELRDNLDKEILKEAKKLLKEIDTKELSDLTKEASDVAKEISDEALFNELP